MAGQSHPCKQKNLIQDFLIKRCINPKRISKIDSGVTNKIIMTFAKGDLPWNWEKSARTETTFDTLWEDKATVSVYLTQHVYGHFEDITG